MIMNPNVYQAGVEHETCEVHEVVIGFRCPLQRVQCRIVSEGAQDMQQRSGMPEAQSQPSQQVAKGHSHKSPNPGITCLRPCA